MNKSNEQKEKELREVIKQKIKDYSFNKFQIKDLLEIVKDDLGGNKQRSLIRKMEDFGLDLKNEGRKFIKDNKISDIIKELFED